MSNMNTIMNNMMNNMMNQTQNTSQTLSLQQGEAGASVQEQQEIARAGEQAAHDLESNSDQELQPQPSSSAQNTKKWRLKRRATVDEQWKKPLKTRMLNELDARERELTDLQVDIEGLVEKNEMLEEENERLQTRAILASNNNPYFTSLHETQKKSRKLVAWYDEQVALLFEMARDGDLASIRQVAGNFEDEAKNQKEASGLFSGRFHDDNDDEDDDDNDTVMTDDM